MVDTLVPGPEARPDVLPSERLLKNGMCAPEWRTDLRRIDDGRNALSVLSLWGAVVGVVALSVWVNNPIGYVVAFIVMGPMHARFAILMHESAHKLLFSNKRANDFVGKWFIAYPAMMPISIYRRGPLRTPPRGVRPRRARHGLLQGLSLRPAERPTTAAAARRRRASRDTRTSSPSSSATTKAPSRAIASSILGCAGPAVRTRSGSAPGAWWSYPRASGGCRG